MHVKWLVGFSVTLRLEGLKLPAYRKILEILTLQGNIKRLKAARYVP